MRTLQILRLAVVQQEFDRIAVIVGHLLDFQRPQAGLPQPVCVTQTLAYVISLAEQQLQRAGIQCLQNLPEDLPDVLAVESPLKQVFLNLALNAAEAMPDGGQLMITATHQAGKVFIELTDTGPGIPPENQVHLFEPFYTTKTAGSGLGLAVCHEIVANHGGELMIDSTPGAGATFTVMLPSNER